MNRVYENIIQTCTSGGTPSAASRQSALRVVAILEGAMMLARTLDDPSVFEDATRNLP